MVEKWGREEESGEGRNKRKKGRKGKKRKRNGLLRGRKSSLNPQYLIVFSLLLLQSRNRCISTYHGSRERLILNTDINQSHVPLYTKSNHEFYTKRQFSHYHDTSVTLDSSSSQIVKKKNQLRKIIRWEKNNQVRKIIS